MIYLFTYRGIFLTRLSQTSCFSRSVFLIRQFHHLAYSKSLTAQRDVTGSRPINRVCFINCSLVWVLMSFWKSCPGQEPFKAPSDELNAHQCLNLRKQEWTLTTQWKKSEDRRWKDIRESCVSSSTAATRHFRRSHFTEFTHYCVLWRKFLSKSWHWSEPVGFLRRKISWEFLSLNCCFFRSLD